MRYAISLLNYRPGRIGGAEAYLRGLIAALSRVPGDDEMLLVVHRDNAGAIASPGAREIVVDRSARGILLSRALEAFTPYRDRLVERVLRKAAPDVVLFPQQSLFPKRLACRAVLTVVDVQHLILPQNIAWSERLFRRAIYPYSLRRADRLIAISDFTRQTLLDRCGVAAERVWTIPLGFEPPAGPADDAPLPAAVARYLYYPAATWPHKNHALLLRTIAALRAGGRFDHGVILSGMQTRHWRRLQRLIRHLGLEPVIRHEGFVSRARVAALYRGADAVVFPSQFEGFGLPVLEAAAYGKKVIVSRLPVFEEIGVPEEFRIDFSQPEQLLQALQRPGPTVLQKRPATWEECATATHRLLRAVAESAAEGA